MHMKGHPAPDFRYLFSLAVQSLSKSSQEIISPYSFDQSGNSVSPLPDLSPSEMTPMASMASMAPMTTATTATTTPLQPQAAIPIPSIPPQRGFAELSPIPPIVIVQPPIQPQLASSHMTTSHRRREITVATHYFQCCKCHKKRAVPM